MHKLISREKNLNFLFIILYLSIWGCIDTNFENIFKFLNESNFRNTLLLIRSTLPYLIFSIIIFISVDIKKFISKNKNINLIFLIFLLLFCLTLFSHFLSNNYYIFTYYFFISIFLIFYFSYASNKGFLDISFFISIFFLSLLVLVYGFLSIKYFLTTHNLNLYGTFPDVYASLLVFSSNVIRSSGLARNTVILLIPLYLFLLISPISKKKFILLFFLSFLLYLSQSRLVLIYLLMFFFFSIIIFHRKEKMDKLLRKILILIVLPFLLTGIIVVSKKKILTNDFLVNLIINVYTKKNITEENVDVEEKINYLKKLKEYEYISPFIRKIDETTFSSGRVLYWNQILEKNQRIWIGNGFLGDRFLINNNASNLFFYSYASGGLISLILLTIIILRSFYVCVNLIFINKIELKKENLILISSIFLLSFFVFRGIGENSFGIFSIDMIIFLQSLLICEKKIEILNKINVKKK